MNRRAGAGVGVALTLITAAAAAFGLPRLLWAILGAVGVWMLVLALLSEKDEDANEGEAPAPRPVSPTQTNFGDGDSPILVGGDVHGGIHVRGGGEGVPRGRLVEIAPEELSAYYRGALSDVQADALARPYLGKRIEVKGIVQNVTALGDDQPPFLVFVVTRQAEQANVIVRFPNDARGDVEVMRRGEEIAVHGRIAAISADFVTLEDPEFVD